MRDAAAKGRIVRQERLQILRTCGAGSVGNCPDSRLYGSSALLETDLKAVPYSPFYYATIERCPCIHSPTASKIRIGAYEPVIARVPCVSRQKRDCLFGVFQNCGVEPLNVTSIIQLLLKCRKVAPMKRESPEQIIRYADILAAMGTESRLRVIRLLLSAHPKGMVVGEIQAELGVSASNLSHHLEKLKHEGLINVKREGAYLRCTANTELLQELLEFLFSECCARDRKSVV